MIIVAGGDSFVWGSELSDCTHCGPNGHSKNTYSAKLAGNNLYECIAFPGYGNDAIARSVIDYCQSNKNKKLGLIVSWTFPGRYEFRFNSGWQSINSWSIGKGYDDGDELNQHVKHEKQKAIILGTHQFAEAYYKHLGEYWEIYATLKEIVYLQNYLKVNNIPYLFTCADANFLDSYTVKSTDQSIAALLTQIDFNSWFFFPEHKGFYSWALDNKYSVGDTHPLEQAHADAYELIKDKFNELVLQSNQSNQT